ncbi:MAG: NADH-quinone oxidoreductase subunit J family protein [Acidimicrobiales bacterium]
MNELLLAATRATIPDVVTYVICAAVVLSGAIGVVTSRNPVHAALSLILTLFGVAVLFIEQDAQFLAAVQVIVYAGAIVVLFLFVIMFLGVDRREDLRSEPLRGQRPLAVFLMLVSAAGVIALAATSNWTTGARAVAGSTTAGGHTNVYLLGKSVFTTYLFAFEATAGLLVIAVVGAVVLARRPPPADEEPDGPQAVASGEDVAPGQGGGAGDADRAGGTTAAGGDAAGAAGDGGAPEPTETGGDMEQRVGAGREETS